MCNKPSQSQIDAMSSFYGSIEAARTAWKEVAAQAKAQGDTVSICINGQIITEHSRLANHYEGCDCPVHGTKARKTYTFGSSMSAETDVVTFRGCQCAVAIRHDPIGVLNSTPTYHSTFDAASGVGKFHAMEAAAKYR